MISITSIITTVGLRRDALGFGRKRTRSLRSMIWLSAPWVVVDARAISADGIGSWLLRVGRTGSPRTIVRTLEPFGIIRDDHVDFLFTRPHRRGGALFPPAGAARLRRSHRARRPNGARACWRTEMADQGPDAGGHCDMSIAPGTARHSGRHLHLLPAHRFLGRVGRWLGLHLSQFRHRRRSGCALRPSRRP